jgi:hypothetical protein
MNEIKFVPFNNSKKETSKINYKQQIGTYIPEKTNKKIGSQSKPWQNSEISYDLETDKVNYYLYNTSQNLFITGQAGTGKSTLLGELRKYCQAENISFAITAPTGIAAINVSGQTFFQISIHSAKDSKSLSFPKQAILKDLQVLIIDEISMVSGDIFEVINKRMQKAKGNKFYFGGIRVLLFGDIFQLGPVKKEEEGGYFFQSEIFEMLLHTNQIRTLELTKIWRQSDLAFIKLLGKIRQNEATAKELLDFKITSNCIELVKKQGFGVLCSTNYKAKYYNDLFLEDISEPTYQFDGKLEGDFGYQSSLPDETLCLKKSCMVVMVKNNPEGEWVNGDFGTVLGFECMLEFRNKDKVQILEFEDYRDKVEKMKKELEKQKKLDYEFVKAHYFIKVKIHRSNKIVQVKQENWEKIIFEPTDKSERQNDGSVSWTRVLEPKVTGRYTQFPLKIGYAITVHKSQGMTLEGVVIDFGKGTFGSGLAYVALSRVKSKANLYLTSPLLCQDILLDPIIIEFWKSLCLPRLFE